MTFIPYRPCLNPKPHPFWKRVWAAITRDYLPPIRCWKCLPCECTEAHAKWLARIESEEKECWK